VRNVGLKHLRYGVYIVAMVLVTNVLLAGDAVGVAERYSSVLKTSMVDAVAPVGDIGGKNYNGGVYDMKVVDSYSTVDLKAVEKLADDKIVQAQELIDAMANTREDMLRFYKARNIRNVVSRAMSPGFANQSVLTETNLSGYQIDKVLVGTGLEGLGSAYAEAEDETGISALFLVSLSILESNWGNSYFAQARNNIFGFQAFTNNPSAARHFNSKEECIEIVSRFIKNNYLTVGGRFHRGFTVRAINHFYASDPEWHSKVVNIMIRVANRIGISR